MAFAALILSAGALGDRIGAKRVFTAGFAVFTAASAACGLAASLAVLIAARASAAARSGGGRWAPARRCQRALLIAAGLSLAVVVLATRTPAGQT